MKLEFEKIDNPEISKRVSELSNYGELNTTQDLIFLDISDDYIHAINPLLKEKNIAKPDYFGLFGIGAHISIVYPGEGRPSSIPKGDQFYFSITGLYKVNADHKFYYVLGVLSPQLSALRCEWGLPDTLTFEKYWVDLHITIGVRV